MKITPLIRTIEENFDAFEHIGMIKSTSEDKTIYNFNPQHGEGSAKITKDATNYYFYEADYRVNAGYKLWQCISERYAILGMVEQGETISAQGAGEVKSPAIPMGISFYVNPISPTNDWMYCPPKTHCKGYGIVLREAFLKEQLFDSALKKFGESADFFDIVRKAGNTCLPAFTQVIMYLKNCNYEKKAYQVALNAKIMELIAVLIDAIEHMSERDACYLSDYDRNAIHSAKKILESHIIVPPTVKALSREVGLNVNKLQLGFRVLYGVTAMEYLRAFRMEKSLELLPQAISLAKVAESVGYKSTSRFSEAFYNKYKLTPSHYRKFL